MKNTKLALALAAMLIASATMFAQKPLFRPRMEIATFETEQAGTVQKALEVFYMDDETPRTYYLSLGRMGIGGDIVQLDLDPVSELFIPLGNTLEEAVAKMEEIKAFFGQPKLSTMEVRGSLSIAYPGSELVPVKVTRRQALASKLLEFSIPVPGEDGFVRAAYVSKSDFGSLLSSVKIYRKIHPKVK